MTTAKTGDDVIINYVVRTADGRVVGSTEREGPQTLKLGAGNIFPQIEEGLAGMTAGEEKAVTVKCADAFGPRREELVVKIPRTQLPAEQPPQPGMQLSARSQDGNTIQLLITDVGESEVTADGNHPLAGEDLHFSLTLVEIKNAA